MGDFSSAPFNVSAVIFDLDGTLLSTEQVSKGVLKEFLATYGKVPDIEKEKKRLGMTQKESAIVIVQDYDLPLTPGQYTQQILPFYHGKWLQAKALPGADRLMKHLQKHGVPFALASNSLRKNIDAKISHQQGWKEYFAVILGSDQVKAGKPSPDIFLEAASRMGIRAVDCLVVEDSIIGVKAARAAGMKVVAVPSLQSDSDQYFMADCVLHSLLEFQPESWGLPPFGDWVDNTFLPVEPIHIKCLYSDGLLHDCADDSVPSLPDQHFGLYFGWAQLDTNEIVKILMSIGWEDDCGPSKRKIQACFVDRCEQICEQKIQILVLGYIQGPNNKGSLLRSLEICAEDILTAGAALNLPEFSDDLCNF